METLVANLGSARRVKNSQGNWLVAPMTLIVPGVLDGSKGPLYYPPEEIARNYRRWDGFPLTRNHPTTNSGDPASAFDDGILERVGMGVVRNPRIVDNKLVADGWFHETRTKAVDKAIWNALERGQQLELSTGLGVVDDPSPGTCPYSSRAYNAVARDYSPDHVAVLTDGQLGACSISDGCGVNNKRQTSQDTTMNRDAAVTHLTTNCACWKGKKETLNNKQLFTDEEVVTLATNHQNAVLLTNSLRSISEAVGAPKTLTLNELPAFIEEKIEDKEKKEGEEPIINSETCADCGGELIDGKCKCKDAAPAPAMNRRAQTTEQWIAQAPPEARAMLNGLIANERSAKSELITKLVCNAAAPIAAQLRKAYARNTVDELKAMVSAMTVTNKQRNDDSDPLTLYFGAGGGADHEQIDNAANDQGVEYTGSWPASA